MHRAAGVARGPKKSPEAGPESPGRAETLKAARSPGPRVGESYASAERWFSQFAAGRSADAAPCDR